MTRQWRLTETMCKSSPLNVHLPLLWISKSSRFSTFALLLLSPSEFVLRKYSFLLSLILWHDGTLIDSLRTVQTGKTLQLELAKYIWVYLMFLMWTMSTHQPTYSTLSYLKLARRRGKKRWKSNSLKKDLFGTQAVGPQRKLRLLRKSLEKRNYWPIICQRHSKRRTNQRFNQRIECFTVCIENVQNDVIQNNECNHDRFKAFDCCLFTHWQIWQA